MAKYFNSGPASLQIMDTAWPWTMHKAAEAFPFVSCTIQPGSVQYSKLQHWCAAMMFFSKVLWFLKFGALSQILFYFWPEFTLKERNFFKVSKFFCHQVPVSCEIKSLMCSNFFNRNCNISSWKIWFESIFFSFDEFSYRGHKNIKSIVNGTKGFFGKDIRKSPHFEAKP